MRWFLDMNIIIYFCLELGHPLEEKTKLFVKKKGNSKFLLCEYIQKQNLPKWIKRQEEILKRFNVMVLGQQIKGDPVYLFNKDKIFLNRLILIYKNSKDKERFRINTNKIFSLIKIKVRLFLEKYIDEFIIPEIDFELKSHLLSFLNLGSAIKNDSDAKTIASAIQAHKEKPLTIITADKKDWTKDLLEEVHYHIDLKKKYSSLPKIKYIQDFK